jgi:hypothetical protein
MLVILDVTRWALLDGNEQRPRPETGTQAPKLKATGRSGPGYSGRVRTGRVQPLSVVWEAEEQWAWESGRVGARPCRWACRRA